MIKKIVYEAARLWIRYFPSRFGKDMAWEFVSWRVFNYEATRTMFGATMAGNTKDTIQKHIYYFGTWEPHISAFVSSRLKKGDYFIDIGANIGYYSLLASTLIEKEGKVIAIEASPKVFEMLQRHIKINDFQNIKTICCAVSNKRDKLVIHHAEESNIGATSVVHNFKQSFEPDMEVDAAPLGDILLNDEISRARIIKIDVEGAEWLVIEGMESVFPKLRDDVEILLEVTPETLEHFGKKFDDLLAVFTKFGFNAYTIRNEYKPDDYLYRVPFARPERLKGTPTKLIDLVFSREDKERL